MDDADQELALRAVLFAAVGTAGYVLGSSLICIGNDALLLADWFNSIMF
jgi:hypothetical protein